MKTPYRFHTFAACLATFLSAHSAGAATYFWDNNGTEAGFGSAAGTWGAPTAGSPTQGWSTDNTGATLPTEVTTTDADALNFGAAAAGLAAGSITVNGTVSANTITFPASSGAITLTGGTLSLNGATRSIIAQNTGNTIASDISFTGGGTLSFSRNTAAAGAFFINGKITGTAGLSFTTPNVNSAGNNQVIHLSATPDYPGGTTITTGNINNQLTVRAAAADVLPATTVLTLNGGNGNGSGRAVNFDLNGKNQTIAGLTNVTGLTDRFQRIINTSTDPATLTIDGAGTHTFTGNIGFANATINHAGISLTKAGTGTQILTGGNPYNGTTTVQDGKLLGTTGGNHPNSAVTVTAESATYGVNIIAANRWTAKSLTYSAKGTLEFNFGAIVPSDTVAPLNITGVADFSTAAPRVVVNTTTAPFPGTYPLATWGSIEGNPPVTADLTVTTLSPDTAASLAVVDDSLNLVITSTSTSLVKGNNTNNLNLASSWVTATVPNATTVAEWNSTVTGPNSTVLGADQVWSGILIANPGGPVTIGGTHTLSIGASQFDINMTQATADLTLNCPLVLTADGLWSVGENRTLTVAGPVSGPFPLTKTGLGTTVLSGTNTYSGNTTVQEGTLRLGGANTLPSGESAGNVAVSGSLDLNGNSLSINGLSGAATGIINNAAPAAVTLTLGNNNAGGTFNGTLDNSGGSLTLVKTGTGTITLGGQNTLTGSVTVNEGVLAFSNTAPFDFAESITLAGGATFRPSTPNALIQTPITIGAAGTTTTINACSVAGAGGSAPVPFSIDAPISGDGDLTFSGIQTTNAYGHITLNAESDYLGNTLLTCTGSTNTNLFLNLGTENALPVTTAVHIDGGNGTGGGRFCHLDLNGYNQTLAGLSNTPGRTLRSQRVTNSTSTESILTIDNTADFTWSGQLGSGNGLFALVKKGMGTFTLAGTNTYTGTTTVNAGTLALAASDALADGSNLTVGNATLAAASGVSDTLGTLALNGNATLRLGLGTTLTFADSSALDWSTGSLTLTGAFVSGVSLKFGPGGLTPAQIAKISSPGFSDFALNEAGFLTATGSGGYTAWAAANAGEQAANLDWDNDGVPNGVEFFLNAAPGFTANPVLGPGNSISWINGGNLPASAYGTQFVIQTSNDLSSWTDVLVNNLTTNTGDIGTPGILTYTLTGTAPRFVRLKVTPQ